MCEIIVHLTPGAKKEELSIQDDLFSGSPIFKIKVKAAPQDGKANQALINYLSEYFNIPKSKIKLIQGFTSRIKKVRIEQKEILNLLLKKSQ